MSKQNIRFWDLAHPCEHVQTPLSIKKQTNNHVVCNRTERHPCFFEDDEGHWVTADSEQYVEMLRRCFILALRRRKWVDMNTACLLYTSDAADER